MAGQAVAGQPNLVGHAVNFLPLRTEVDLGESLDFDGMEARYVVGLKKYVKHDLFVNVVMESATGAQVTVRSVREIQSTLPLASQGGIPDGASGAGSTPWDRRVSDPSIPMHHPQRPRSGVRPRV